MSVVRWMLVVVLLIVAVPAALFTIQNADWTAQLSLDLHFWATRLKAPMAVPHLMWMAFGGGLLTGLVTIPVLRFLFSGGSDSYGDGYGGSAV